jgi:beta-glucosidase/6-phospho-beta-glucosidase/beta-galactosidase
MLKKIPFDKTKNWSSQILSSLSVIGKVLPNKFSFPLVLPKLGSITDIGGRGTKLSWPKETVRIMQLLPSQGIFHAGIESSDPFVGVRRNQLREAHDFYENYEQRLRNIAALGIKWLRFGVPYSEAHTGPGQYNFELLDKVLPLCDELGITLIYDMLHFGVPDWLHQDNPDQPYFQNFSFPNYFAEYAAVLANRYPTLHYFTIINEPFVTANFSAKWGIWNEQRAASGWEDDRTFVIAAYNIARAAILAKEAIEQVWQDEARKNEPIFVQNESFEVMVAAPGSSREQEAQIFNIRRFSLLDLIFGHRDQEMKEFLQSQRMRESDYEWCMERGNTRGVILGIDHYPHCVQICDVNDEIELQPLNRYQLYELTKVYWERYKTPLLHAEVNAWPEYAEAICTKTYEALTQLQNEGYPIVGMGWYGDEYFYGWEDALQDPAKATESPVGLYYKGEPQPIAAVFARYAERGIPISRKSRWLSIKR